MRNIIKVVDNKFPYKMKFSKSNNSMTLHLLYQPSLVLHLLYHPSIVLPLNLHNGYAHRCIQNKRADNFSSERESLANWLKQVKMEHRICPEIPEALKSGALPSIDLANLLVFAP